MSEGRKREEERVRKVNKGIVEIIIVVKGRKLEEKKGTEKKIRERKKLRERRKEVLVWRERNRLQDCPTLPLLLSAPSPNPQRPEVSQVQSSVSFPRCFGPSWPFVASPLFTGRSFLIFISVIGDHKYSFSHHTS